MGLSSIFYLLLGSRACGPNRAGIKSVQLTNLCSLPRSAIIGESAMASNLTGITLASVLTPGTRAVIDSAETAALWASINTQTTAMPAPQYTYVTYPLSGDSTANPYISQAQYAITRYGHGVVDPSGAYGNTWAENDTLPAAFTLDKLGLVTQATPDAF